MSPEPPGTGTQAPRRLWGREWLCTKKNKNTHFQVLLFALCVDRVTKNDPWNQRDI